MKGLEWVLEIRKAPEGAYDIIYRVINICMNEEVNMSSEKRSPSLYYHNFTYTGAVALSYAYVVVNFMFMDFNIDIDQLTIRKLRGWRGEVCGIACNTFGDPHIVNITG